MNHWADGPVPGEVHTWGIDNFWSLLKRSLRRTYISHRALLLVRWVDEQMFRYNYRATKDYQLNDADRFALAVAQIPGTGLTYAELTGKMGEKVPFLPCSLDRIPDARET